MHQFLKLILFWNNALHVLDSLSRHHQEFKIVPTATGVCQTGTAASLLAETSCSISFPLNSVWVASSLQTRRHPYRVTNTSVA